MLEESYFLCFFGKYVVFVLRFTEFFDVVF